MLTATLLCICVCVFVCMLECFINWVSEEACSKIDINRCEFVCQHSTCAWLCVTHSCTAGYAFSAGSCCTVNRWHSWKKCQASNNAHCCCFCTLSLWLLSLSPSPSLSDGLFLCSYPAEEQEKQTQREVLYGKFV